VDSVATRADVRHTIARPLKTFVAVVTLLGGARVVLTVVTVARPPINGYFAQLALITSRLPGPTATVRASSDPDRNHSRSLRQRCSWIYHAGGPGLALALISTRVLRRLVFETEPLDSRDAAVGCFAVVGASRLACYCRRDAQRKSIPSTC